VKKYKRMKI